MFKRDVEISSMEWQTYYLGFRANSIKVSAELDIEMDILNSPRRVRQFEQDDISVEIIKLRCVNRVPVTVSIEAR